MLTFVTCQPSDHIPKRLVEFQRSKEGNSREEKNGSHTYTVQAAPWSGKPTETMIFIYNIGLLELLKNKKVRYNNNEFVIIIIQTSRRNSAKHYKYYRTK